MQNWYVVHTKPRSEVQVRNTLSPKCTEVYLPLVRVHRVNPRARPVMPFFPGYLFVRVDMACVGTSALNWAPGVLRLLSFDGEPAIVPDAVIEHIRRRIPEVERSGELGLGPFRQGDLVRITAGPFRDLEAVFDQALSPNGRMQVLIEFLGRVVKSEVSLDALEKLDRRQTAPR